MNILNEKVYHANFGVGIVSETKEDRIKVQFNEEIGTKGFLYPEAFSNFLRADDLTVGNSIIEELREKQERLEKERLEKEREAAELEAEIESIKSPKKKTAKKKA